MGKFYSRPDPIELVETSKITIERAREVIEEATRRVEKELKCAITPRTVSEEKELGNTTIALDQFPISGGGLDQIPPVGSVEFDDRLGLVISEIPRGTYRVNYQVGYGEGHLPVLLQLAIEATIQAILGGDQQNDLSHYREVWREKRKELEKERDVLKTNRKV